MMPPLPLNDNSDFLLPGAIFTLFGLCWCVALAFQQVKRRQRAEASSSAFLQLRNYKYIGAEWSGLSRPLYITVLVERWLRQVCALAGIIYELTRLDFLGAQRTLLYAVFALGSLVEHWRAILPAKSHLVMYVLGFVLEAIMLINSQQSTQQLLLLLTTVFSCAFCTSLELRGGLLFSYGRCLFTLVQGTWQINMSQSKSALGLAYTCHITIVLAALVAQYWLIEKTTQPQQQSKDIVVKYHGSSFSHNLTNMSNTYFKSGDENDNEERQRLLRMLSNDGGTSVTTSIEYNDVIVISEEDEEEVQEQIGGDNQQDTRKRVVKKKIAKILKLKKMCLIL